MNSFKIRNMCSCKNYEFHTHKTTIIIPGFRMFTVVCLYTLEIGSSNGLF